MRLGQEHAATVAAMQAEHELQSGVLEDLVAAANADCQRRLRGEAVTPPGFIGVIPKFLKTIVRHGLKSMPGLLKVRTFHCKHLN